MSEQSFEIFLITQPGLEEMLAAEVREKGFGKTTVLKGGVTIAGDWPDVWRANLVLRGATRVLVRIGSFRSPHLAQLDKRSRKFPWGEFLTPDSTVMIETTCKKSKIYHAGAATQRIAKAITEEAGKKIVKKDADITIKARILDDLCTISLDTSGESLHKRGHKVAVNKAPMRETMASLFLRFCGFDGTEPVIDPLCGSGTFVIEAAEINADLAPGRSRHFAFEKFKTFDSNLWQKIKQEQPAAKTTGQFFGFDRDAGAIEMSISNAKRAGVENRTSFTQQPISELTPPTETPGLVIMNPPYGGRIGNKKKLFALYQTIGQTLLERFPGWRVGLVTDTPALAKQTGLPFTSESNTISHGGIPIKIYVTAPLGEV